MPSKLLRHVLEREYAQAVHAYNVAIVIRLKPSKNASCRQAANSTGSPPVSTKATRQSASDVTSSSTKPVAIATKSFLNVSGPRGAVCAVCQYIVSKTENVTMRCCGRSAYVLYRKYSDFIQASRCTTFATVTG